MRHSRLNWTEEEQQKLKNLKESQNCVSWKLIAKQLNRIYTDKTRTGKQCRERYMNYVRFIQTLQISGSWNTQQDLILFKKFSVFGAKWVLMSRLMPGRSQNSLKNRFYGIMRKILRRIEKYLKQKKIKNRKPFCLQTLIQVLDFSNKKQRSSEQDASTTSQSKHYLHGLSFDIFKLSLTSQEDADENLLKYVVQGLNQFVIKNRQILKQNIAKSKLLKQINILQSKERMEEDQEPENLQIIGQIIKGDACNFFLDKQLQKTKLEEDQAQWNNPRAKDISMCFEQNINQNYQNFNDIFDVIGEIQENYQLLY